MIGTIIVIDIIKIIIIKIIIIIIIIINIYSGWPRKSQRPIASGLFPLGATET